MPAFSKRLDECFFELPGSIHQGIKYKGTVIDLTPGKACREGFPACAPHLFALEVSKTHTVKEVNTQRSLEALHKCNRFVN